MNVSSQKRYRVHEFARLAGVTVRALHQYHRFGLLKPAARSGSGYRQYTVTDFVTLQQILALRFFGFTLEEIKRLIVGADLSIARAILEQKQEQLGHVITAIREAQELPEACRATGWHAFTSSMARIQKLRPGDPQISDKSRIL